MILLPAILAIYETQAEKDHVTALFEAHHRAMYHEARQIPTSHEDAEDAVQEAFVIIHDHLDKLTNITCHKTRGYVVLVAKNLAKNMLRKRRRERTMQIEDIPFELPDTKESAHARIEIEEVISEIEALPETPREILLLKYYHQCSDKELAAIMGIRHDTVRKRVERARALLTERLA